MAPWWPSWLGFRSRTAEQVTDGIDASHLTAIVTGASGGLGAETARVLALRGAQVVMAVRNTLSGETVKSSILKETDTARIHVMQLDVSSMGSVRKFASDFEASRLPLNILINNAGMFGGPFELSADGIELQFATNHIGPFLLTNLLLDNMKRTAQISGIEGRIVNVSSKIHEVTYQGGIKFDKLNESSSYSKGLAYGQSKLANVLHSKELARRFKEEGVNITANSLHPGLTFTNVFRHHAQIFGWLHFCTQFFWKTIPQGAATQCYLALHPAVKGISGKYFYDCKETKPSSYARHEKLANNLWDFSEKLTKGQNSNTN